MFRPVVRLGFIPVVLLSICAYAGLEDRLVDESMEPAPTPTPDWSEPGPLPRNVTGTESFGVLTPAARQPTGALSGRIVYMNGGHGWTYDPAFSPPWRLLRGVLQEMNEDYGNIDQLNMFAMYCFNAGAVVVPFRPLGQQPNEAVMDNDDAGVVYTGSWANSSSTVFYGSAGDVPYRYATMSPTETATATYTPNIPVAGYYPVYAWALSGSDRGWQLYRIRHTGGESEVRLPHHMVGGGWVYLGDYYFNAGVNSAVGSVVISNLRGTAEGSVVIADAIRFGNGMGSADNGGGGSGYPREDESARYWIKNSLGQGQSSDLYDGSSHDESDSWSAPPKMSAYMNREQSGDVHKRIHISFHSNAGGGRGTLALITSDPTTNQAQLAQIAGKEVNDDLVALGSLLEAPWQNRTTFTYSGGYSEIDGSLFNYEMPATIIEVAFHDNVTDAQLMRDSKARAAVGKAAMHAVIKFMNQYDTASPVPLAFLPDEPTNPRAISMTPGQITLAWNAPVPRGGSQGPTNYVVYRSTDGFGFGNPVSVGLTTSFTVTNLPANTDFYFRITAANAGGESMPSEIVGCRAPATAGAKKVLIVNAFDRFDRTTNLRQDTTRQGYAAPDGSGAIERVWPRRVNAFHYVVSHGKAIASVASENYSFDSCQNEAVINNIVALANYPIVIWACGNESITQETFNSTEQSRISAYLAGGGALFASGTDIANDLDRASGPTAADRAFLNGQLRAGFGSDNSGVWTVGAAAGSIFAGLANGTIDNGSGGIYWVQSPDVLLPLGTGTRAAAFYTGGSSAAAIQYDGSAGSGRVVLLGFPFETITSTALRNQYMARVLAFLSVPPLTNSPAVVLSQPQGGTIVQGTTANLSVVAGGSAPMTYQWSLNGAPIPGATESAFLKANALPADSGFYQVTVTNAFGAATSQVVLVEVALPPTLQTSYVDNFDVNSSGNWNVNQSSADTRVTFNYNYAADGIAAAPGAGGTTRGVKFEANMTGGAVAAISISPKNQAFTGNHRLRYNLWINANGPFPAGGTGSTQHGTCGLGTSGNRVQWTGAGSTADGTWFAVDGEGQATDTPTTSLSDYNAFSGTSVYAAGSGIYAAGTDSTARGNLHGYYATGFPGGQTAPAAQQSAYPQQTGGLEPGTIGFAWREVIVSKEGSTVTWFIDGLPIATVNNVNHSANNIFVGYWDSFASLSDNTSLSFGLVDNLRVERFVTNVPPYVTAQPQQLVVQAGSSGAFNVTAGGTTPLSYQWRFNGQDIPGATGSAYPLNNVQPSEAGVYTVAIANAGGSIVSAGAVLSVVLPPPPTLEMVSVDAESRLRLLLSGDPASYAIEASTNLVHWTVYTNLTLSGSPAEFTAEAVTNRPVQFYRAKY